MIDPRRIEAIVRDSLYNDGELDDAGNPSPDFKQGDGIVQQFGFHPERLESHRTEVVATLRELHPDFMHTKGGGMSFLRLPFDASGHQWGEHADAGRLCALGSALGLIEFPLPRELWAVLPGGVPYIVVRDDLFDKLVA